MDNWIEYIIPCILILAYFISSLRKKSSPSKRPGVPKQHTMVKRSEKQVRQLSSKPSAAAPSQDVSAPLKLDGVFAYSEIDPAYAHKTHPKKPRITQLISSKKSLRDAFLIQEVIKRPYE